MLRHAVPRFLLMLHSCSRFGLFRVLRVLRVLREQNGSRGPATAGVATPLVRMVAKVSRRPTPRVLSKPFAAHARLFLWGQLQARQPRDVGHTQKGVYHTHHGNEAHGAETLGFQDRGAGPWRCAVREGAAARARCALRQSAPNLLCQRRDWARELRDRSGAAWAVAARG